MSGEMMNFPDTAEEFMEQYKIVDSEEVYTNGAELVPIFRMKQWFEQHPEPHWIPVTERLPETDGYGHYFLVCLENGVVRIDGFSRTFTTRCPDGFYYETDHFTWRQNQNKVVAWMPLPEPYKPTVPPECEGDCGWCKPSVIEKCKGVTE